MNSLAGTGSLIRLALRRERIQLTAWVLVTALLVITTASAFVSLYPTTQSRAEFAFSVQSSAALRALTGPVFDLSTIGGLTAWRITGIDGILLGLMVTFTVIRHTRKDEEAGRLELLGAGVVGRSAPLTATLTVVFGAGLVAGLLTALGLLAQGLPAAGSFAMGLGLSGMAWVFAAVAGVAAQLSENSRTAIGISSTVLGLSFVLRALSDSAGPSWLSWLSPIGWAQQLRSFAGERWWVLGLFAALIAVLLVAAYFLVSRRDLGAGLFAARRGPAEAGTGLRGTVGLAWRLNRGSLLAWTVWSVVFGSALGGLAQGATDILKTSSQLEHVFEALGGKQYLIDAYFSAVMGILGLVAAIFAVQATLRLRSEETSQRAEPLLAAAVGRIRWAASQLLFALLGAVVLMAFAGLGMGLAYGLSTGDVGAQIPRLLAAGLVQIPAAWVLSGIGVALFGLLPGFSVLTWAILALFFLLGQLGPLLSLSQWVMDLSPFTHVPKLPGGDFTATPVVWLLVVTAVLMTAGLMGFRRRDIG